MPQPFQVTNCQCDQPGWCERHRCEKPPLWWQLCQRETQLFAAWERGGGPGQSPLAVRSEPCAHRGDVVRLECCATCRGRVEIKVFGCSVCGECTLVQPICAVATCAGCSSFEPLSSPTESGSVDHAT